MEGKTRTLATLATVLIAGIGLVACSSDASAPVAASRPAATSSSGLEIFPSKIYSGFDGKNTFRAPIIVSGAKGVKWSIDDPTIASLAPNDDGTELMITMKKAGKATLTASAGTKKATAPLSV